MKIGVRPGPLHLRKDMPALVQWLARNDFDSIDLTEPDRAQVEMCTANGLVPGSFDVPAMGAVLNQDHAAADAAATAVVTAIQTAADLGLHTLFTALAPVRRDLPRAESFRIFARVFPAIVECAEAHDVTIAIEPWPGGGPHYPNLGCTPETWRAMFAAVASPALGLCYDPSHMVRLGIDYRRVLGEFGDRIHHVHAKDCALLPEAQYLHGRLGPTFGAPAFRCSEGWWRYCIPGDGEVNWRDVVVGLHVAGYTGVVSIELEDGMYMDDDDANRRGLLAARDCLRAVSP